MERIRNENGKYLKTHGQTKTRLYGVWCAMKERCQNPHNKSYKNYGAKNIKVCDEWSLHFEAFFDWAIQSGYKSGLTIDRIDAKGNYRPENCRWATIKEQNRNYSRNHIVEYGGKKYCLIELAETFGIPYATIQYRIRAGYTVENAIKKGDNRYGTKQKRNF